MDKRILFSRMKRSYFFIIGVAGIIVIFLLCYILPLFIHWDPLANSLRDRFLPPVGLSQGLQGHILGTDSLGRDELIRLLVGGQYSFYIAFICVALQISVGTVLGIVSGYIGGIVDTVIMRACDVVMSIPGLVLAMSIMAIFGISTGNLIFCLTFTGWVNITKVTRNDVRVVKHQEFIMASSVLGAKLPHIMFKQIFPNVTTNIIILGSQRIGMTILIEAALSYLNLGIQPPAPSWGNMISAGRTYLTTQPWLILAPGAILFIAVLSFSFLGDGIRDVLDTKRKI